MDHSHYTLPGAPRAARGSLLSSNSSFSPVTDVLLGPFPSSGSLSPVSPSTPVAKLALPPAQPPPCTPASGLAALPGAPTEKRAQLQQKTQDGARGSEEGTGSAFHNGGKQCWCHLLPALMHVPPVAACSSLQPGWTRGWAKSPQLKFQDWQPGSHAAAQRRLEGFTRFPHKAGSFARKSKFINSVFQHEQTKASELDSQISQGLSMAPPQHPPPLGGTVPSLHHPASQDFPCSLESLHLEVSVTDVLLGNTLATAALAARARQQSWLQRDHKQQGWPLGQTQPTAASCPARAKSHKFQCIALKKVFISLQARKFLTAPPVPEEDKLPHW